MDKVERNGVVIEFEWGGRLFVANNSGGEVDILMECYDHWGCLKCISIYSLQDGEAFDSNTYDIRPFEWTRQPAGKGGFALDLCWVSVRQDGRGEICRYGTG